MQESNYTNQLRGWIAPGATVYTVLRSVSRSGMRREITLIVADPRSRELITPSYAVGQLLDLRTGKSDGLIVCGTGMDMGFHLVHRLAHALYDDGYALRHRWL